ncbi:MAG: GtrA family protein [Clostridia bacterium]|nr:GtrA family protein [Clostridia bacterium]
MGEKLKKLLNSEAVRYLIIGISTTLVNFLLFWIFCNLTSMGDSETSINAANAIAVFLSILFAYFANKIIVFRSKTDSLKAFFLEMSRFILSRLGTMLIEVVGVWLAVSVIGQNEILGKLETQLIVIIGNYFISKFIVFKKEEKSGKG